MTDAPKSETKNPGSLRSLLPQRRRRLLIGMLMVSVSVFLLASSGQFRSIDDENLYYTTHSLTSGLPNVDICKGANQAADFLYTRGPYGCLDPNQEQLQNSYQRGAHGKFVSKYGIGEPLAAAPFFGAGRIVAGILSDGGEGRCTGNTAIACCRALINNPDDFRANCQGDTHDMIVQTSTLFTNSLLTAITLVLVMIVSLQLGASMKGSLLIGLAFGFGSYAFAYAKTLGAEPGTAMCLIAGVMFAIEAARSGSTKALVASGIAAGAAVLFRPTSLLFLPVFGIWFLIVGRRKGDLKSAIRYGALFSAGAVVSLVIFMILNAWRYGDALSIGYGQTGSNLHGIRARGSLITGLWGLWLSPGKSLFLYAPFVLVAVAGIVISVKKLPTEMSLLIALVLANTLLFARVRFWSGDWAWGPRYMIIVLPCLAVMCAPLVNMIRWRRALMVLAGLGFVFPGALGVIVNFNTFYQRANRALGANFRNTVYHDWAWQPIWRHLGVLGNEWGNLGKPYGLLYLSGQPRLDLWWLDDRWWLTQHTGRLTAVILMMLTIGALAAGGAFIISRALRGPLEPAPVTEKPTTTKAQLARSRLRRGGI